MKITEVSLFKVTGHMPDPPFPPGDRCTSPLDVYQAVDWRPASPDTSKASQTLDALYTEIHTDDGVSGLYGPIFDHQAFLIASQLRPLLVGRDPLATETLADLMLRLNRHGRAGMFVTALSAIDCALWDLKGKIWSQPVYRLLGGPTRHRIPAYASMLGFAIDPETAAQAAAAYKAKGFPAQKWFFRYGPSDGEHGKTRNLAMAHAVRDAVGPQYPLMFDAIMSWDVMYASDLVKALESVNPTWMEEPLPPEQVGGLRTVRQASRVPIATGEHVHTRWQVKDLLVHEAVDVLQTDPDWAGGISEQMKICALASAFSIPVIAHGHSLLPALHIAGAQSPTVVPWVEYLIRHQERQQYFQAPIYRPESGHLELPERPGLGLVLDEDKIEAYTPLNVEGAGTP